MNSKIACHHIFQNRQQVINFNYATIKGNLIMIQTEYEFTLTIGYQDESGTLHREGIMRLATAADEIEPLRDSRVQANPAYLFVLLFSRVITRLGSVDHVNPKLIECLYATDLAYIQNLYNNINHQEKAHAHVACPNCCHTLNLTIKA